jgi:hypothetical protein
MENPVRIYVLHHPESAPDGKASVVKELTDRIYDWFRLPSLDGIPVYVRSWPLRPELDPDCSQRQEPLDWPSFPYGMRAERPVLEYIIPLVDAHMVRDPVWHDYLVELAKRCDANAKGEQPGFRGVMLPVALDPTAFNLPPMVSRRNYIRHGMDSGGGDGTHRSSTEDVEETLKHLTEALARDLDHHIFGHESRSNARFKIFISYARADGSDIAKALRNYIQSQTQCLAFLDENDIGYGQFFDESLQANAGELARAMIVVNTDSYADRTWCRWEIDRFTRPHEIAAQQLALKGQNSRVHFFQPLLVVDAINGTRMTRVIPELAQAPMIRWDESRARLCFSSLMREAVLGLRAARVAQQEFEEDKSSHTSILVNRLPGPVAIDRLLREYGASAAANEARTYTIRYPGNGMSLVELRLLKKTFDKKPCEKKSERVRFRAFQDLLPEGKESDRSRDLALVRMKELLEKVEEGGGSLPLRSKVIAISTSYCTEDLASMGTLEQHQDEALIHLLRPLLRLGADLSYGGLPPKLAAHRSATRNITCSLLRLVSEERPEEQTGAQSDQGSNARGPLLFNVCAWPRYESITVQDEAAWINSYRILRFKPELAGLAPWDGTIPTSDEQPPAGYQRYVACVTSAIRARQSEGHDFRLPGGELYKMKPAVFVFMGGRLSGFSGVMPGIMEEFLFAAKTGRPIFLFGGLGGASGVIARALCGEGDAPKELTLAHYCRQPVVRKHEDFNVLLKELRPEDPRPEPLFDELWSLIQKHRGGDLGQLFNNGLSDGENRQLIRTLNTSEAVSLAWQGISRKFL